MTKKTKKEIVKTISNEIGLTQQKTKEIVQKTFDAIVDILVDEGRIELRKFGVFQVKRRAARKARNPRTGEKVDVAERFVVTFKPGKEMEERVMAMEERENRRLRDEAALQAPKVKATATVEQSADSKASAVFDATQTPMSGLPADSENSIKSPILPGSPNVPPMPTDPMPTDPMPTDPMPTDPMVDPGDRR